MGKTKPQVGLIRTKYSRPGINQYLVSRQRLHQKLDYSKKCKLTQVIAPAGYGKTTAVLDWLGQCGLPSAWLSLDGEDNNPVTFWRYVCAALEGITEGAAQDTEYVFASRDMMQANIHLSILIDKLSEVSSDFLLVLDDLHLISDPSILAGLSYLIDYLPGNMHLVFISRTEPELDLARHRVKWQIQRLEEEELRFSETEIISFYHARGITLENADLEEVEDYTEGWAAALVAVTLSMAESGGTDAIRALTRSSRDIGQYLKNEVMRTWSAEKISFAMKTSILKTLSEDLCAALTGDRRGGLLLKEIYEQSGFLQDLDGRKQEYRYHYLFKSFLRELLQETAPEEIPDLYARAGLWFREQGRMPEAIEHFLRGGFYQEALELIEHEIDYLIDKNDYGTLLPWIGRLPAEYRDFSFKIAAIYTTYYAQIERYDLSKQWLDRMKALKDNCQNSSGSEESNYRQTVCIMVEANLLAREGSIGFVQLLVAAAETDGGKYYKMPEYHDFNIADIYFYRCPINRLTNMLKEASEQYQRVIDNYRGMISKNPGYAPLWAGEYLYESNRLEEALPYLLKGQEEAREANCPGALVPAMVDIARIKRANGDITGAFSVLEECERRLRNSGKLHWDYLLQAFRCRLFLDAGHTDKVQEWFSDGKLHIFTEISRIREFELIVYARVLIFVNQTQDAELLLQRLLTFTAENGRLHSRVEVLNLLALLAFRDNHARTALKYLDESLNIGMAEGYIRSYLDELPPMAQLLRAYIKSRRNSSDGHRAKEKKSFAGNLLKQINGSTLQAAEAGDEAAAGIAVKILEQLTEQEKKVLELIANAATNQEIGDKLGISLWTVKTHTGNIYGKLGLKNRA